MNINPSRALISVSDKSNVVEFARKLSERGVEILSTGGTAALLTQNGVQVTDVSAHTGYAEIMDGRVKTLHPKIHGGILGRRNIDHEVMSQNDIAPIDLVVVNLYPFEKTVANPDCSLDDAIEQIDIGGPAMLRAAAKNHAWVTVVVDQSDYHRILAELEDGRTGLSAALRFDLAVKAFQHTASYDAAVASWLGRQSSDDAKNAGAFPGVWNRQYQLVNEMRYGENPHQKAAFYAEQTVSGNQNVSATIASARLLQGKPMSYNNIADADAALECVRQFCDGPACVIVKHANPCGVALGDDLLTAYDNAFQTDAESAFGGIIAFSQALDPRTAAAIIERQFVEVIIAPEVPNAAAKILATKPNIRVLECGQLTLADAGSFEVKTINGGLLVQSSDYELFDALKVVTKRQPDAAEMRDLEFAWKVAKYVKSNAIVYVSKQRTIGVGAGQMSRVNSARIAAIKAQHAGLSVAGAVMASDAFFPFRDGLDNAASVGIRAVIQPGGSMRDDDVIAAADEHNIAMVFTGMRHFRH